MSPFFAVISFFFILFFLIFLCKCNWKPCAHGSMREFMWLCIGSLGFYFAGPCQAYIPISSLVNWRCTAWIAAIVLYLLAFWLTGRWVLKYPYTIAIYQVSPLTAGKLFYRLVRSLDPNVKIVRDTAYLPTLKATMELNFFSATSYATIKVRGSGRALVMKQNPIAFLNEQLQGKKRNELVIYLVSLGLIFAVLFCLTLFGVHFYKEILSGFMCFIYT